MSEEISKSKQKRLDRKKAIKEQKQKELMSKLGMLAIPVLVILAIVAIVLYRKSLQVDYSKYLAKDGTIAGINIDDYCTTTYEQMSFAKADLVESEYTIESDIQKQIDDHATLITDDSKTSEYGDRVNITYTAVCEGNEVESYTAENPKEYTIGTYEILGTFDEDLTGKTVGDEWVSSVVMDEDYYNTEIAGKTVDYTVKLTGIYVTEEFDDAFVQKYLSEDADSVEGYRQFLADKYYKENLRSAITDSISNNCIITSYPEKLIENEEKIAKYDDKKTMEMYAGYGYALENPWDLYGYETEEEYNTYVHEQATEAVADSLYRQAIFTKAGLTNTEEEVKNYFMTTNGLDETTYNNYVKEYGFNYMAHSAMMNKVIDYLVDNVTVTE